MSEEDKEDPRYVYHFTSEKGKDGIQKSGKINASVKRDGDVAFGENKVYMTKQNPEKNTGYDIAMNNYDGSPEYARSRLPDTKYAIGFDPKKINAKQEPTSRSVYTVKGDLPISKAEVVYEQQKDGSYKKIASKSKQK